MPLLIDPLSIPPKKRARWINPYYGWSPPAPVKGNQNLVNDHKIEAPVEHRTNDGKGRQGRMKGKPSDSHEILVGEDKNEMSVD